MIGLWLAVTNRLGLFIISSLLFWHAECSPRAMCGRNLSQRTLFVYAPGGSRFKQVLATFPVRIRCNFFTDLNVFK